MGSERRVWATGLLGLLLWVSSAATAEAIVNERGLSINGIPTVTRELVYGAAEPTELTGLAVVVSSNNLPDDATIDVLLDGIPSGLQVVVPPGATGVFSSQGLVQVPTGSTFGFRWFTDQATGGGSTPSAAVTFTLHTRPMTIASAAPVSSSSTIGLGLLALLLAAVSLQRLRTVS